MIKALLLVVVAVALGFMLNPGPDAHREKLKSEIAARSQIAGLLGISHLAALVSTYHTLGVASYSTVNGRTVTWGAYGIVFVPNLPTK